jgi:beta-phosphoglucomutase-like phosphatase (HAD superfamily)
VIEDSTNGVRAAKAAGICVGYNSIHSKAQDLSEADVIINHFAELILKSYIYSIQIRNN